MTISKQERMLLPQDKYPHPHPQTAARRPQRSKASASRYGWYGAGVRAVWANQGQVHCPSQPTNKKRLQAHTHTARLVVFLSVRSSEHAPIPANPLSTLTQSLHPKTTHIYWKV
ncbi:hypothetical protein ABW19_dt0201342 [Dactylella cylindrospora]|nr:hypothetical protein ABW19_dt0201342 [Dactylella cylindrospora]